MKTVFLSLSLTFIISFTAHAQGWHTISVPGRADSGSSSMKHAMPFAAGFGLNGYSYVGNGDNQFARYNALLNVWEDLPCPAPARAQPVSFTINGKGYWGCGQGRQDMWEVDLSNGIWTRLADRPGPMNVPRIIYSSSLDDYTCENALVIGNSAYFGYGNDFYQFTPATNTWTHKHRFPGDAAGGVAMFTVHGKGYYVGGWQQFYGPSLQVWMYDPGIDSFIRKSDLTSYAVVGGGSVHDTGYIFMSGTVVRPLAYDPVLDTWSPRSSSPQYTFSPYAYYYAVPNSSTIFASGNDLYIGNSYSHGTLTDSHFWKYNPATDTWSDRAAMSSSWRYGASSATIGHTAYMLGGFLNYGVATNELWAYDGQTESWTQKSPLPAAPRGWPFVLSYNNKIYAGGGFVEWGNYYFHDLWEYDPSTDHWMQKSDMPGDSLGMMFAVVAGGKLHVGNYMYDPATDSWARRDSFTNYYDGPALHYPDRQSSVAGNEVYFPIAGPITVYHSALPSNQVNIYHYNLATHTYRNDTLPQAFADTIARVYTSTAQQNRRVWVRDGKLDFLYGRLLLEYDTLSKLWSRLPDFPSVTGDHGTGFSIGRKLYHGFNTNVLVGYDLPQYSRMWVYDDDYHQPTLIDELVSADIKVYPNPSTTQFNISCPDQYLTNITVGIFDLSGRKYNISMHQEPGQLTFDSQGLPNGVYTVKIDYQGSSITKKLVHFSRD